jgi:hypothetical protein
VVDECVGCHAIDCTHAGVERDETVQHSLQHKTRAYGHSRGVPLSHAASLDTDSRQWASQRVSNTYRHHVLMLRGCTTRPLPACMAPTTVSENITGQFKIELHLTANDKTSASSTHIPIAESKRWCSCSTILKRGSSHCSQRDHSHTGNHAVHRTRMTRDAHAIFLMKTVGLSNDECAVQAARAMHTHCQHITSSAV